MFWADCWCFNMPRIWNYPEGQRWPFSLSDPDKWRSSRAWIVLSSERLTSQREKGNDVSRSPLFSLYKQQWLLWFLSPCFLQLGTIVCRTMSHTWIKACSVKFLLKKTPREIKALSVRILGDGWNLMDWDASPSITRTCVKVAWRTQSEALSGETGGWREAHLLKRLSLRYLVNVIINTVI